LNVEFISVQFYRLSIKGGGEVDYRQMAEELNWRTNLVAPNKPETYSCDETWLGNQAAVVVQDVNVLAMLQDLSGVDRS